MAEAEDRPRSSASTIDDPDLVRDTAHPPAAVWSPKFKQEDAVPQADPQQVSPVSPQTDQQPPAQYDSNAQPETRTPPEEKTTMAEDDGTAAETRRQPASHVKDEPFVPIAAAPGKRGANAEYGHSSVYSGNKIKHLKKEDGIPLWRKDIQYEFLRAVFEDQTKVFSNTSVYKKNGYTFADVYIHAMAISSKTSKILRDKLMSDRKAAIHMAMVCLLVNVGRMNTTLNFFPEMRAQLRTYHSIPCLQARQDPNAYKQLQDAPRLKSILKGASEDKKEPTTIEEIVAQTENRTNPVNLIFVLAHHALRVSELHFTAPREFFDLITRTTLSSKSRARAFLWIMWWYLESDFSAEDAKNNPFGPGLPSDDPDGVPRKVPAFDHLTDEQAKAENVDTAEEITYGEQKRIERLKIMQADAAAAAASAAAATTTPKGSRKSDRDGTPGYETFLESRPHGRGRARRLPLESYPSNTDHTRSASPAPRSGRGRWPRNPVDRANAQQRLVLKTKMAQVADGSSPAPPGSSHPILHPEGNVIGPGGRRSRPLTAHQQAVKRNRAHRVEYILDRKMRSMYKTYRRQRLREGALWRAWTRHDAMADPFADSEDEDAKAKSASGPARQQGYGGLMPLEAEEEDWGEELGAYAAALRRVGRRLERWDIVDRGGQTDEEASRAKERGKLRLKKSREAEPVFDDDDGEGEWEGVEDGDGEGEGDSEDLGPEGLDDIDARDGEEMELD